MWCLSQITLEVSIVFLEESFTVIYDDYSTGVTYNDDHNMFITQAHWLHQLQNFINVINLFSLSEKILLDHFIIFKTTSDLLTFLNENSQK